MRVVAEENQMLLLFSEFRNAMLMIFLTKPEEVLPFPYMCQSTKSVKATSLTLWKWIVPGHCSANCWLLSPTTVRFRMRFCAQGTSHGLDVGLSESLELLDVHGVFAAQIDGGQMYSLAVLAVKTAESWEALEFCPAEESFLLQRFLRPGFRVELVFVIQYMAWLSWKV